MYTIRFDIHIVKLQEAVTYMSPVEMSMTGIKTFRKNCPCLFCLFPYGLDYRGSKYGILSEQDCVTGIAKELVFKKHKCTVLWPLNNFTFNF